jgi:hypothetical protein
MYADNATQDFVLLAQSKTGADAVEQMPPYAEGTFISLSKKHNIDPKHVLFVTAAMSTCFEAAKENLSACIVRVKRPECLMQNGDEMTSTDPSDLESLTDLSNAVSNLALT